VAKYWDGWLNTGLGGYKHRDAWLSTGMGGLVHVGMGG
jgi:hypothetical protein